MANGIFINEEKLLFQAQLTAEHDAVFEPDFDKMPERQSSAARQFRGGDLPTRQPAAVAILRGVGTERKFALLAHGR